MPSASQSSASSASAGRCLPSVTKSVIDGPPAPRAAGRRARRSRAARRRRRRRTARRSCFSGVGVVACSISLDADDLERPGDRVDLEDPVLRPVHRLVVVVHPDQDVDIALLGVKDDRPVLLVDPDRADLVVLDAVDLLVVDRRRRRVGLELLGEVPDLPLLGSGQRAKASRNSVAMATVGMGGSLRQ